MNTVTQGMTEYVALDDVFNEFGITEPRYKSLIKDFVPKVYEQVLFGKRYIPLENCQKFEAEFLKYSHKKAAYRQAIGIIGRWDCLYTDDTIDDRNKIITSKWSSILNTRITPSDVNNLVYIWVTMREDEAIKYNRPDDTDFRNIALRWSIELKVNLNGDDAEQMLSIYVENKDFFEKSYL